MMASSAVKRVTIKRQLQQFSVQDKLDAIQRVNEGESKASVARDIGVPESTLRGWCKSEEKLRNSCDNENRHSPTTVSLAALADNITANGSLDLAAKRPRLSAASEPQAKEADVDSEALWFWLRQQQQHMTGLSEQLLGGQQAAKTSSAIAAAAAAAVAANSTVMADLNPTTGWFWRWYKRYGLNIPETMAATAPVMTPSSSASRTPIPAHTSSLHAMTPAALPGPAHTASLMPTHLHPVSPEAEAAVEEPSDDEDDEPPLTAADAVAHGEKFLRWLDCCSDPSITALQILQFRYLLNNVRACAARRAKANK